MKTNRECFGQLYNYITRKKLKMYKTMLKVDVLDDSNTSVMLAS